MELVAMDKVWNPPPAGQKKGCHKSEAACPDACMHTKIAGGLGYNTDIMGEQS